MKHILLATTIAASTFAGAASAEQYVCETGSAVGYKFNAGLDTWIQQPFEDDRRYLINTDALTVSVFGSEINLYDGDDCFVSTAGFMRCLPSDKPHTMTFNPELMRFVLTQHGYVLGDEISFEPLTAVGEYANLGN